MPNPPWLDTLEDMLPRLGHRNWIVVADGAYPDQISPGIVTATASDPHLEVVRRVLSLIDDAPHIRPSLLIDSELASLDETDAPGSALFCAELSSILAGRETTTLPHDEIIAQLGAAGASFRILVIKTNLAIPYTTVFIRLECGYWNDDAEVRLRRRID